MKDQGGVGLAIREKITRSAVSTPNAEFTEERLVTVTLKLHNMVVQLLSRFLEAYGRTESTCGTRAQSEPSGHNKQFVFMDVKVRTRVT